MAKSREEHLLDIVKSKKSEITSLKRGVFLEKELGKKIDELFDDVCIERYHHSEKVLAVAKAEAAKALPSYRLVI